MKTKILKGIVMLSAVVLGACSTNKYAAQQKDYNDDVYFSKAKAGDAVEYASNNRSYRNDGYYDDYSSRINRFGGYSPFAYDGFYNSYYGAGLGLGLGYGLGSLYGYSPYSLYSPYSFYSPYSYYGAGYGLGGYGYGGLYSAYGTVSSNNGRPSRGTGNPNAAYRGTLNSGMTRTSTTGGRTYGGSNNQVPAATQSIPQRSFPTYNSPSNSSMGGGFSSGGGGRVSSGRPGRG